MLRPTSLDRIEAQPSFVERARHSLARAEAGAPVCDGPAYAAYLRERVRASLNGEKPAVKKPKAATLTATPKFCHRQTELATPSLFRWGQTH